MKFPSLLASLFVLTLFGVAPARGADDACPPCPTCASPAKPAPSKLELTPVDLTLLPGWSDDDLAPALAAFTIGCRALRGQPEWREACAAAALVGPGNDAARAFFESNFTALQVVSAEGSATGLITGYYEPELRGARRRGGAFQHPLFGVPADLVQVDLGAVAPPSKELRLRGRVDGRKLVPYYSRAEIEREPSPLAGVELVWVDNAVESFFLHIQGSGRVRFDDGTLVRMGYADQNGHPYRSLGRALIDAGELSAEDATMQGIKAWAEKNSARQREFLWRNPSYVFFRELPASEDGPIGSLGVPLSAGRSVAIDARLLPLGAPVYLATTWPGAETPLRRLMLAQDTGGAIRGAPRADFFWGAGAEAGDFAGRMRQSGAMWVLLPREHPLARGAR